MTMVVFSSSKNVRSSILCLGRIRYLTNHPGLLVSTNSLTILHSSLRTISSFIIFILTSPSSSLSLSFSHPLYHIIIVQSSINHHSHQSIYRPVNLLSGPDNHKEPELKLSSYNSINNRSNSNGRVV